MNQNINGVEFIAGSRESIVKDVAKLGEMVKYDAHEIPAAARSMGESVPSEVYTRSAGLDYLFDSAPRVTKDEAKALRKKAKRAYDEGRKAPRRRFLWSPDAASRAADLEDATEKELLRRAARRSADERENGDRPMLADSMLDWAELAAQPAPRWIVDGVIPERATVIVYGASGVGKSFLCQSIAASLAGGFDWLGRPVEAGTVLYVFAEGGAGAGKRFQALADAWNHGKAIDGLRVLPVAPNLTLDSDVAELVALNTAHDFAAIVYDTLNRVAGDAEENSATAMGGVLNAIEKIRRTGSRTSSVIVTHSGKNGDLRGSTALWAAADTVLELTGEPGFLRLEARKQKDAAEGLVGHYRLKPVEAHGTLILEGVAPGQGEPAGVLAARVEESLAHFVRAFGETGATRAQFVELLVDSGTAKKSTAQNYVGDLINSGRLIATAQGTRGTRLELAPDRTTFPR